MFRWRENVNAGVVMVTSPYNPHGVQEYFEASPISPIGLIYRNVNQIGLGTKSPQSWMLDRALTVEELLPMLTQNGAYATFQGTSKGSLMPGKLADLVILSANPLEVAPEEIGALQTLVVLINGETAFGLAGSEGRCATQVSAQE